MNEGIDRSLSDEAKWTAQTAPDNPERADAVSGHLGSGLYLCGLCGKPVKKHSTRYRCPGHIMRSREQIDHFVRSVVRARLGKADFGDVLPSQDEPRIRATKAEGDQHPAEVIRAQSDYDIKGIREREAERMPQTAGSNVSPAHNAEHLVSAFDNFDLRTQRAVIAVLCEVRLYPRSRGVNRFDPKTVQIHWR